MALLPCRAQLLAPGVVDRARCDKLCFQVAAEHNIRTPSGHIGGDCHHPGPPGLGDDLRFLFVVFGVQHLVLDPGLAETCGKRLRGLHGSGSYQHRRTLCHAILDVDHDGIEFLFLAQVDKVVEILALLWNVSGNNQYIKAIYLAELKGLGVGSTGHAGKLAIETEVILESGGRQGLALALDGDTLFCLNRLVQAFRQAASGHGAAGVLIDQHDLPVLQNVLHVPVEHDMGAQP